MRRIKAKYEFGKDLVLIFVGAVLAVFLSKIGAIEFFIELIGDQAVASFVAGLFFTSAFTIAPASVALSNIAGPTPALSIALWGALGAVCGDLILFFFIRDRFVRDLKNVVRPSVVKHIINSFHLGFFKWLAPIVGALIIASPLPDEIGLTLMGMSKTRVALIIPISFVMNLLGIYIVVLLAQAF